MSKHTNGWESKASRTLGRCRYTSILMGFFGFFAACCALGSHGLAQSKPEIRAEVDATELFVGESVTLQVDLLNVSRPSPPNIKGLEELFGVEVLGEQSLNQLSMMSINGRVTRQEIFRHVYQYKLTPKQAGTLAISPLIAEVD
ncbi:MAG: BatD family protein, partial [Planctomycetes bacterium]|nr:BatD family protein [Planctomycetota bacterium]